jgi:hypothetical protein
MSEHHPHHHDHAHHREAQPIISRRWQVAAIVGNAVVGAAEIAGGLAASAYSVVADGLHNGADVYTYWLQSKNLLQRHKLSEEKQQRNRKIAHWVLCATSVGVAAKAGVDLATDKESVHNTINIYTSAASVAFNGLLFAGLYRGIRRRKQAGGGGMDHLEKDITKHFAYSDMPSAALALGGAYLHSKGMVGAEQMAAIASGVLSAAVFRPTKNNLAHDHDHFGNAEHDLSSDHHEHPQHTSGIKRAINKVKQLKPDFAFNKNRDTAKKPRWRRAAAALTSLAIIGGLMGESIASEDQEQTTHLAAQHNSFKTEPERTIVPRSEVVDTYSCVEVESGDSIWAMASDQINRAIDAPASNGQTNAVTLLAVQQTGLANPDLLQVGDCVEMPSADAIEFLFASPNLAAEVNELNAMSWEQVFAEEQLFDGINQKLEQCVAT